VKRRGYYFVEDYKELSNCINNHNLVPAETEGELNGLPSSDVLDVDHGDPQKLVDKRKELLGTI